MGSFFYLSVLFFYFNFSEILIQLDKKKLENGLHIFNELHTMANVFVQLVLVINISNIGTFYSVEEISHFYCLLKDKSICVSAYFMSHALAGPHKHCLKCFCSHQTGFLTDSAPRMACGRHFFVLVYVLCKPVV